jgi:hypothetical protein
MTKTEYLTDYDGIVKIVQMYIDRSKQGKSDLMRPAFHPKASFFGYAGEQLAIGTQFLFDWIDKNEWCEHDLEDNRQSTYPRLFSRVCHHTHHRRPAH